MTVYVDDFNAPYRRMVMVHMIADTDEELHAMADKIGVQRRWWQAPPHDSHYDICQTKKALAIKAGAVAIGYRQLAKMNRRRKVEGTLGKPEEVDVWYDTWRYKKHLV